MNLNQNNRPNRSKSHGNQSFLEERRNRRKRTAGLLAAGTAIGLLAGATLNSNEEKDVLKNPPSTTVVKAREGDTIYELQRAKGMPAGASAQDTIDDAVRLNKAADNDGDPTIHPGDPVILIDNPDNNGQG